MVYRRTRAEMPATPDEVNEAEEEGAHLRLLTAPVSLAAENGVLTGIVCQQMVLGEPDKSGRRRPEPVPGSEFTIPADTLILAIGQEVEGDDVAGVCELTPKGTIAADKLTLLTSRPGVFAGGDCETGPATAVEAIAAGRQGRRSHRRLRLRVAQPRPRAERRAPGWTGTSRSSSTSAPSPCPTSPAAAMPVLPLSARGGSDEVELGFEEAGGAQGSGALPAVHLPRGLQVRACSACRSPTAPAARCSRERRGSSTCSTAGPSCSSTASAASSAIPASRCAPRWSTTACTRWTRPAIPASRPTPTSSRDACPADRAWPPAPRARWSTPSSSPIGSGRSPGCALPAPCAAPAATSTSTSWTSKVVGVSTADDAPVNGNAVCVKGRYHADLIHSPDRLTTPLIRDRATNTFREATWDEALDLDGPAPGRDPRPGRDAGLRGSELRPLHQRRQLADAEVRPGGDAHQQLGPLRTDLTRSHCGRSGHFVRKRRDDQLHRRGGALRRAVHHRVEHHRSPSHHRREDEAGGGPRSQAHRGRPPRHRAGGLRRPPSAAHPGHRCGSHQRHDERHHQRGLGGQAVHRRAVSRTTTPSGRSCRSTRPTW